MPLPRNGHQHLLRFSGLLARMSGVNKLLIGIGMFIGSTIGSYIPALWGSSLLSLTSIFLGVVGGIVGIWLGYQLSKYLGFI